jgi:hypothetical protein
MTSQAATRNSPAMNYTWPEQSGDELYLGPDVAAADVPNLPFLTIAIAS